MAEKSTDPAESSSSAAENGSPTLKNEVDSSSLETLQNLAEASLDGLEESIFSQEKSGRMSVSLEKCVPGPLPKEGKVLSSIKESLLSLIAKSEQEEASDAAITYTRPKRFINNEVQKAALLSHTISAYISSLDKNLVSRIAMQLVSDTTLWISRIFRFFDSLAYFSEDDKEGLIGVIRMVLHTRYLRYSTTGYEALYTRPPVIYYCDQDGHNLGKDCSHIAAKLGLPLSCFTSVRSVFDSIEGQFKMDPAALEKSIKDDLSAAKIPLFVIANAGSSVGHVDNLHKIQEICLANNVWLHVQGHSLAALSLVIVPNLPSNLGDSMTLSLGDWIGVPSLPYITLYKAKEMSHVLGAKLGQASLGHLDFLPVWFTVQTLGYDTLTHMIRHCFEISDLLLQGVEQFSELRIISKKRPIPKDGHHHDISIIGEKSIPTMVLFEAVTPVLVFQFHPRTKADEVSLEKNPPYYDNLNSWLIQLIARQVPTIRTEILELEAFGICLRICPLETAHILGTTKHDVEQYLICLQQQLEILNSTVYKKEKLYQDCKKYTKLQLVEIADWPGMGGVRYIPEFWVDRLNELTDTGKADINNLNSELVNKLRASDSAFSLGEADDGMLCVRFGMVDSDLNLDELMNVVTTAGQEIEESSKFLETMSWMIKQGIEEANKELVQENQEKIMQEGILRHVPVLGSVVSWMYPAPKETGIKGRSFHLTSGTIESTENIYKYHMQIKEGSKSPPTNAKVLSRSSSQASNIEQKSTSSP